ncbi:class F sortase [Microbacterium oleivorans]|uniref:class F sortase n=1 Tax=Microbacterium oleivorans TaxID=273677 RepID=UPI00203C12C5|nr:class F sortase [Microbacterium oleivorans]MCM3696313.1 class F sortase [Microbacterium oleivorans]
MRRPSLIAVALTALMLAACAPVSGVESFPSGTGSGVAGTVSPQPAAPTPRASVPVAPATPQAVVRAPAPERIAISSLDVDMPVESVGVEDTGEMEIPERPSIAGWYRFGKAPADAEGTTVIAAHVDDREYGVGPLAKLRNAREGDEVTVTDADGTVTTYVTQSVTYIPRAELPVDELFTREGPRTLAVITCGGDFDQQTRTYSDNVVLIARAQS